MWQSPSPTLLTTEASRASTLIRAKAPLRISFAGGGTDLPSFYAEHGGAVLSSTINRYVFVSLCPRDDDEIRISSMDFDLMVKYRLNEQPIYDGVLDLAKAAIARINSRTSSHGFDLSFQSDAPAGSGLGGSASLTTAVIGACAEFASIRLSSYEVAELAYTIERRDLGISGGKQDQYTTAFGGFNLIEFSRDRIVVNPLRIDRSTLSDLECHLMLCYTGKTRFSAGLIDKQEAYYRQGRPQTLEGLQTLHRLVYEMKDALLMGKLADFAHLLDVAWGAKLKMNPEVSNPEIDEMYAVARSSGALGGKLLGAGGGGYLLLFCQVEKKRAVRERLEKMGGQFTVFSFVEEGLRTWESACL